ncbi:MAG: 16S rRNA (cytosine(967)-C(5))-methyltransferase RsmB [Thiotrichaceae bacterium]
MMRSNISATNPRTVAAQSLYQVIYQGKSLTEVLQNEAIKALDDTDTALVKDICFGSLRWHHAINIMLDALLTKPLKKKDKDVECLIRVGLYQLHYQQTADHAAVNETVKASKQLKKPWSKALINGVLRSFTRDKQFIIKKIKAHSSFPYWIIKRVKQAWPEQWKEVLVASNQRAPMTLRVNHSKISTAEYLAKLNAVSIAAKAHTLVNSAIELTQPVNVYKLPSFEQGFSSVQDASAQLAAHLLDCKEGMRVLDACAAPGGKTGHIAERCDHLDITAIDNVSHRLALVKDNLDRLGKQATLIEADASDLDAWYNSAGNQLFDRILLDAPCSALGVMRRHPDIKILRQETDIETLVGLQKKLLATLWTILKPGGRLLYATCSILPEENDLQIKQFVSTREAESKVIPLPGTWGTQYEYGRQILPNNDNMDGFYYSLLEKILK